MGSVRLDHVSKQFGEQIVLDDVSLELHDGEIAGIVGPNGAGKSTIFRLILGELQPDLGAVVRSKGLEVGHLPQKPQLDEARTLHDEVLAAFSDILAIEQRMHQVSHRMEKATGAELKSLMSEYERLDMEFVAADGYTLESRVSEILGGLGFSPQDQKLLVSALSGGQKSRAALARLLLRDSSLLLLDEPTNHLDIDTVRWLERFLREHHGGAAIISHDRYLLDRVVDRIIEVDRTKISSFPGNYTNYVETKEIRRITTERQFEKDRAFIEKERDFIAKHIAGQRSAQAKGRRTRLERALKQGDFTLAAPTQRARVEFDFGAKQDITPDRTLLQTEGLSKSFGHKQLFQNLKLELKSQHRLGITGPNGTGKSTLLKVLFDGMPPDDGAFELDPRASVGYYAQEAGGLDPARNILQEVLAVRPDLSEKAARGVLGRFAFRGDDVFKSVSVLSGGEQSRVRLVKLILSMPQLLVLDEPTNHLDIPTREALEDALDDYPGAIITVSHDRYFLDQIVDRLLVIRPGEQRLFKGNYSEYTEQLEREEQAERIRKEEQAQQQKAAAKTARRALRQPGNGAAPAAKRSPLERLSVSELETLIAQRETLIAELTEKFGDPEVCRDRAKLDELNAQVEQARAELAEAEVIWMRKSEATG